MTITDALIPNPCGLPGAINSFIAALLTASLASTTFVIPPGAYIMLPVANCILEIQDPATTWSTIYPVSSGGYFESDGVNFRIRTTATVSYKLYRLT